MTARTRQEVRVERLRDAVAASVERRSLRDVAREIGMSPSGLRKFLTGSRPYSTTRRRLERWYVLECTRQGGDLSTDAALAALHLLSHDLPASQRQDALLSVLDTLVEAHAKAGVAPLWLPEAREHLTGEETTGRG